MANISNAMAIAEASREAMTTPEVVVVGRQFLRTALNGKNPNEETLELFFKYSAMLSAACASRVTTVLLSESDFDSMMNDIREVEDLENLLGD